jgi:hypothetical protein
VGENSSGQPPLLGALLVCGCGPAGPDGSKQAGNCGQRMSGSGDPHEKSSYTCRVSSQNRNRCAGNSIVQIPVENWVSSIFLELLAQPEFARRHAGMVARNLDDGEQSAGKQLEQLRQLQDELAALAEAATGATGLAQAIAIKAVGSKEAEIAEVRAALAESRVAPESLETFIGHDPRQIWDTATQGQRAAWLATVFSRIEILPALSGNGAEKGGFGSCGLDPRRVRIHTHHDPANPIVVSADYQRPAPDMGDPVECPDCHKELENWARRAAHRRWSHGVVSKEKAARGETATEHRCCEKGCPECDRTFALPAHLGRHMAAHRDEKDACDLCGKIVKQGGLALHKTRAHGTLGRAH